MPANNSDPSKPPTTVSKQPTNSTAVRKIETTGTNTAAKPITTAGLDIRTKLQIMGVSAETKQAADTATTNNANSAANIASATPNKPVKVMPNGAVMATPFKESTATPLKVMPPNTAIKATPNKSVLFTPTASATSAASAIVTPATAIKTATGIAITATPGTMITTPAGADTRPRMPLSSVQKVDVKKNSEAKSLKSTQECREKGENILAQNPVEALGYFELGLTFEPNNPQLLHQKSNALRNLGRLKAALACINTAIQNYCSQKSISDDKLDDTAIIMYHAKASICIDMNQPDLAIECCNKIYGVATNIRRTSYLYGNAYFHKGDNKHAIKHYREAVQKFNSKDPICIDSYFMMGRAYLRMKQYGDAKQQFAFVNLHQKTNAKAFYFRGECCFMEGNKKYPDAIKCFKEALRLEPQNDDASRYLAKIYFSMEDYISANDCLNRALEAISVNEEILPNKHTVASRLYRNQAMIYKAGERLDDALFLCKKALGYDPNYAVAQKDKDELMQAIEKQKIEKEQAEKRAAAPRTVKKASPEKRDVPTTVKKPSPEKHRAPQTVNKASPEKRAIPQTVKKPSPEKTVTQTVAQTVTQTVTQTVVQTTKQTVIKVKPSEKEDKNIDRNEDKKPDEKRPEIRNDKREERKQANDKPVNDKPVSDKPANNKPIPPIVISAGSPKKSPTHTITRSPGHIPRSPVKNRPVLADKTPSQNSVTKPVAPQSERKPPVIKPPVIRPAATNSSQTSTTVAYNVMIAKDIPLSAAISSNASKENQARKENNANRATAAL